MVTCMDVNNLKLDGMELVAGESGLKRMVSWTYLVQTRPYEEHMNRGNFALIVIDYIRFDFKEVRKSMDELNNLGISGLAVSVVDDKEPIPKSIIKRANELCLPLFYVRWKGASFVDISQSIGNLILETNIMNKRTGDYLYNLLFGYNVNDRYVEKISGQFGFDFNKPYRVGIIAVDRTYGINLEQDEHLYEYYANCLNSEVMKMEGRPMFMKFLNKFVLLFEAKENKEIEHEIERMLRKLDDKPEFKGIISSTCILGTPYTDPSKFGQSYQEAKGLIPKKGLSSESQEKEGLKCECNGNLQVYVPR